MPCVHRFDRRPCARRRAPAVQRGGACPAWRNQPRCHCPATGGPGNKKKCGGRERCRPLRMHGPAPSLRAKCARAPWMRPRRCSIAMDDDRLRAHHPRAHPPLQPPCRSAAAASAATSCPGEAHRHLAVAPSPCMLHAANVHRAHRRPTTTAPSSSTSPWHTSAPDSPLHENRSGLPVTPPNAHSRRAHLELTILSGRRDSDSLRVSELGLSKTSRAPGRWRLILLAALVGLAKPS